MFNEILERFRSGRDYSGVEFVKAWQRLRQMRLIYNAITAPYDAVLMPTSPIQPPDKNRLETDSDYYVRANFLALRNTRIGNLMGLCGLSLPTSVPSCGLMLLGAPYSERNMLRLGSAIASIL